MASDMKGWDVFRAPKWILDKLLEKYKVMTISYYGGFTSSYSGGAGGTGTPFVAYVYTSTTPNSAGRLYAYARFLNSGNLPSYEFVDWTKDLELHFLLIHSGNDPEAVSYVQLKESNAEGALAQRGIGIELQNLTLYGEGYGTSRGTVNLGTLTSGYIVKIKIVKKSSKIEFYVNNELKGTLTGSAVPNVPGTAPAFFVLSARNGSTGVNVYHGIGDLKIIQKW
jgi:hypothetical protein